MKNVLVILLALIVLGAKAQEEDGYTENKKDPPLGGYISFDTKISRFQSEPAIFSGVKFGMMIDEKYTIGFAGYGLSENNNFTYIDNGNTHTFKNKTGYGGFFIEYIFYHGHPIHISTPLIIGGGKTSIKENVELDQHEFDHAHNREDTYWATVEESEFFILEPGIMLEADLLKWIRLGFGATYQWVIGNSLYSLPNADEDFSGFSFNVSLKLGSF